MSHPIRLLVLEDTPSDAELAIHELVRSGIEPDWVRVDTEEDFLRQLGPELDLIIADYKLPQFSALGAIQAVRERGLDVPIVIVSGTIGEERAVELVREGAADYVLKDRLARLATAASRAMELHQQRASERRAVQALRESAERLRALVENSSDGIALYGRDGTLELVGPAAERILGYPEDDLAARSLGEIVHPEDAQRASALLARLRARPGESITDSLRLRRADGTWRWLEGTAGNLHGNPAVDALVFNFRDITERRTQHERIARLGRMRGVLSGINATITRVRDQARLLEQCCDIVRVDGEVERVWIGLREGNDTEIRWADNADDRGPADSERSRTISRMAAEALTRDRAVVRNDGDADNAARTALAMLPMRISDEAIGVLGLQASGAFDEQELEMLAEVAAAIAFALDYVDRAEQLDYLAYYDPVTDLPNRRLFSDRLNQALVRTPGTQADAVAVVRFDQWSGVVESFNPSVVDRLLRLIAGRLQEAATHPYNDIAHFGTAVFGIRLPASRAGTDLAHAIRTGILEPLSQPIDIDGQELIVSVRVGIAVAPDDGGDAETLLYNAEAALLKAEQSVERYVFYSQDIHHRISRKLSLENGLRIALDREQFTLAYQPKIDCRTGGLTGLEALLRWNEPDRGPIPPAEFIPVLEQTDMISDVGNWVISRALADYGRWLHKGLEVPSIAVNVSPRQLHRKQFIDHVEYAVRELEQGHSVFELEITENVLMEGSEGNVDVVQTLREIGARIAIDDFGTGYSSLSYLSRMLVSALKIDRSFIANMTRGPDDTAIVTSIISLAHTLNLVVIAEGVETEEQSSLLNLLRCDQLQGYLLARPAPPEQIDSLLRALPA